MKFKKTMKYYYQVELSKNQPQTQFKTMLEKLPKKNIERKYLPLKTTLVNVFVLILFISFLTISLFKINDKSSLAERIEDYYEKNEIKTKLSNSFDELIKIFGGNR